MRIVDRLRRLERAAVPDGDRMSEAELVAAENRVRERVAAYPPPGSPVSFEAMRTLIRARAPGWLQRIRANMDPEDLLV